ncbi:MAG: energy-coupling factor transporter ATPase [Firmicutes bacterium]|nr:energy-coupling factor transporter ATPase [Bacillota bacterium]
MDFIKVEDLIFEYIKTDEGGATVSFRAIDGVSFTVQRGSFTAIIGQNGSGKSTLAKNLNGLLLPTAGKVYIDGLDTSVPENMWNVRQQVAMVFQNPDNQIVSAIVEDDVAFGPENLGIDPLEIRRRVDSALEGVEMGDYKEKAPHLLSGGQKQRIAIAGAIAMEPECIVFDEPTAMLDPRGRREVLSIAKDLNRKGMTVVFITHFMEEAACADQVIVLDNGVIKLEGTPREVFSRTKELKELSLGVPAAVQLASDLRNRGIDLPKDILTDEELIEALLKAKEEAEVKSL